MELERIRSLMSLMETSLIEELHLEEEGFSLTLRKASGIAATSRPIEGAPAKAQPPSAASSPGRKTRTIATPMPGIVYLSPAPGEPPFVTVGAGVSAGQTVAIIEAMKTMTPVVSETDGIVEAVLVENEQDVEAGRALFEIGQASETTR
jgi:acetyl-CoA carboxylase biotin carboxyl carrier protein